MDDSTSIDLIPMVPPKELAVYGLWILRRSTGERGPMGDGLSAAAFAANNGVETAIN